MLNLKLFAETFHDLCDGLTMINNLFAIHLVPTLLAMLVVDVFGMYNIFRFFSSSTGDTVSNTIILYYILMHFILRVFIAYIGSTTTSEPEILIEMMAKLINKLNFNHPSRFVLYNYMKQFQTRNFKLQTLFLTINWNILLGVRFY